MDVGRHFGQVALNRLALGDGPAEGDPLLRPLDGELQGAFGGAQGGDGDEDPADLEEGDQLVGSHALPAQNVVHGHGDVLERQEIVRSAGAPHGVRHGRNGETRHAALDQQDAELPPGALVAAVREAENGEQVGFAGVGDQVLAAVQDVGVASPHRLAVAVEARAAVRFGQAEADQQVARCHGRQVPLPLLRPPRLDHVHAAVVDVQHGANAAVNLGQLLQHRGVLHGAQAEAAVGLGHQAVEEVMLAEFRPQAVERNELVAFDLRHQGRDLAPQKGFHVAQVGLKRGVVRKNHGCSVAGRGRP